MTQKQLLFVIFVNSIWMSTAAGQNGDLKTLNTNNPKVRIARFHSFQIFTGFGPNVLDQNVGAIKTLRAAINEDFYEEFPNLPRLVHVMPNSDEPISAADFTWAEFQSQLTAASQQLEQNDVLFVYLLAHGTWDSEGLKIHFSGDLVPRRQIASQLKTIQSQRHLRLVVFMTDNCSEETTASIESSATPTHVAGVWRALYFGHHGFLDLVSTSRGELGLLAGPSVFSIALSRALNLPAESNATSFLARKQIDAAYIRFLDRNHDGTVSWPEFEVELQRQLDIAYADVKTQIMDSQPDSDIARRISTQPRQTLAILQNPTTGQ
ncbi:MAG TPA: hypothetical protein VH107_15605 [Lacipirellulaceae bacterium]|jgi:hypothetical protein|nr:hypothetical protein [Lacipirellulaceae bacterium]